MPGSIGEPGKKGDIGPPGSDGATGRNGINVRIYNMDMNFDLEKKKLINRLQCLNTNFKSNGENKKYFGIVYYTSLFIIF